MNEPKAALESKMNWANFPRFQAAVNESHVVVIVTHIQHHTHMHNSVNMILASMNHCY